MKKDKVQTAGGTAPLTDAEAEELQTLILEHDESHRHVGAWSHVMHCVGGVFSEVHPRPEFAEFADPVKVWLRTHGFIRFVDVDRGPFYARPHGDGSRPTCGKLRVKPTVAQKH